MTRAYTDEQRIAVFWSRVDRSAGMFECWTWMGATGPKGYGQMFWSGATQYAHRFAWELSNGAISEGLFVCHHCDNPPCVNPAHLFLGTQAENMKDAADKKRTLAEETHPLHKLSAEQVAEIRQIYATSDVPMSTIAKQFGVTPTNIESIAKMETWVRSLPDSHINPISKANAAKRHIRYKSCKLTNAQITEIKVLHANGSASQAALARQFSVSPAMICRILNGERRAQP